MNADIPLIDLNGGVPPGPEDGLDYLPLPHAMRTFQAPPLPEPEEASEHPLTLALLARLQATLEAYRVGEPGRIVALEQLPVAELRLLNQILGEGEVAAQLRGEPPARIQETVLAGVWWVQSGDTRQWLEVAEVPALLRQRGFAGARWPQRADTAPPGGVLNARPVLTELLAVAREHAAVPRRQPHVVNLSLLPFSAEDQRFLAEQLGDGPALILSRGYGNCRIASTATPGIWRVQYFNGSDQLILDSLEVIGVPQVACAAQEDIQDSAERLEEIRGALA
jgi:hydrogenase-1 operon protein HyaF